MSRENPHSTSDSQAQVIWFLGFLRWAGSGKGEPLEEAYPYQQVPGGIEHKNVFLYGPYPMVDELIHQFKNIGLNSKKIIVEDFNLI